MSQQNSTRSHLIEVENMVTEEQKKAFYKLVNIQWNFFKKYADMNFNDDDMWEALNNERENIIGQQEEPYYEYMEKALTAEAWLLHDLGKANKYGN